MLITDVGGHDVAVPLSLPSSALLRAHIEEGGLVFVRTSKTHFVCLVPIKASHPVGLRLFLFLKENLLVATVISDIVRSLHAFRVLQKRLQLVELALVLTSMEWAQGFSSLRLHLVVGVAVAAHAVALDLLEEVARVFLLVYLVCGMCLADLKWPVAHGFGSSVLAVLLLLQ